MFRLRWSIQRKRGTADVCPPSAPPNLNLKVSRSGKVIHKPAELANADPKPLGHTLLAPPSAAFAGIQIMKNEAGDSLCLQ